MASFKCKRSGNIVTFTSEDDIKEIRNHEGYEEIKEVKDGVQDEKIEEASEKMEVLKLRGRPRKNG